MQITSVVFWFRIASTASDVLPVCLSPITSCRWPRPTGTAASIALIPVAKRPRNRLAVQDFGGLGLDRAQRVGLDRALAVQRIAQRIDNPAQKRRARPWR